MSERLPTVFLSHGSPTVLVDDDPAHHFLAGLGDRLPRPRAILMVSAHWETDMPTVSRASVPDTIHDFGGFARELYEIRYPAPGAPDVADRTLELLGQAGIAAQAHSSRGLDHGAWVPMKLMYGAANVPVTQLSIQPRSGPEVHYQVGRALVPLADEGVLVIGSGSLTHNLEEVFRVRLDHDAAVPGWVTAFAEWTADALAERRTGNLLNYRALAPFARENHPTEDHLLPLFVALGAGGAEAVAERLHSSYTFGVLAMDAYAFR